MFSFKCSVLLKRAKFKYKFLHGESALGCFLICDKGKEPKTGKTLLFPSDRPHNRQLVCEIVWVGGTGSIVCSSCNEAKQPLNLSPGIVVLFSVPFCQASIKSCFCSGHTVNVYQIFRIFMTWTAGWTWCTCSREASKSIYEKCGVTFVCEGSFKHLAAVSVLVTSTKWRLRCMTQNLQGNITWTSKRLNHKSFDFRLPNRLDSSESWLHIDFSLFKPTCAANLPFFFQTIYLHLNIF